MPYKNTLNIPSTDFPMRASLSENAKKFREFGDKENIYELIKKRVYQKKFTLHDGPPYANGNIHLGHALNKILKDFILRYKSLTGHQIDYIPGGDTHGLPIENRLEKEGQYKNKSPQEKREACHKYALEQIEIQKGQFEKLHLLCNFKEIYKTLDESFIKNELNIFYSFLEQGLLYWDLKPVAGSGSSKTALAESEIIYKPEECESIYFGFPLEEDFKDIPKNSRFLIGTTTPYTIEANLALAINPDFTYLLIEHENNHGIIVEAQLNSLNIGNKVIKSFKGEYLERAKYRNVLTQEINPVILAAYVTKDTGTGIVHTAPALGLEDYYACQKYNINPYSCIEDNGYFSQNTKFPPINGSFYKDASTTIISGLEKKGYLIKIHKITHNVGHDGRTEKPILYRASPQGFLNVSKLKSQIEGSFSQIKSTPEGIGQKLESLILSRNEGCLSRQRSGGTPIPILFDDDKPILDLEQIKHTIELFNKYGINSGYEKSPDFFLHPNTKVSGKITTSKDILDVGFDSGCSGNILPEKESNLYLEGFDQLRGGFNSSSTISMAVQKKLPFKSLLAHGFVLDGNGNKMSKSKGNVIDPIEIVDKYGADILRLGLATSNYLEDIRLSDTSLQSTITLYRKIRNTLFRYSLSVLGNNFKPNKEILENLKQPENIYIYQSFKDTYRSMLKHLESFHFFKAINSNINFLNMYSNGYLEICKTALYCEKKSSEEYQEITNIIHEVFHKSLIFFSIFIPQTAEEAYSYIDKAHKSILLEDLPNLEGKDYKISENGKAFFPLKDQIYALIEDLKNQKIVSGPQEVSLTLPKEKLIPDFDLRKYLNIAEINLGSEISVSKCSLDKCYRCKRHTKTEDNLCSKCLAFLREIDK